MTIIALTDCCTMLGIDPKTLRTWLTHAQVLVAAHPTDARIKGLSLEQVQQMASMHARPLPSPASARARPEEPVSPHPPREAAHGQAPHLEPVCLPQEADLMQKVVGLQTQVSSMQHQLTQLALDLLHERELRYEWRLQTLEARLPQTAAPSAQPVHAPTSSGPTTRPLPSSQKTTGQHGYNAPTSSGPTTRPLPPTPNRRSRLLPLIEYGAGGSYVVICPKQGELCLTPQSPEWFAWLASLSSFRFVGKEGYFSACRTFHKGPTRFWQAYRMIHQHRYKPSLGATEDLTIACLEQTAALLQSYVDQP